MNKRLSSLTVFFLTLFLLFVAFTGCIEEVHISKELDDIPVKEPQLDKPSILPDWIDGKYHNYFGTMQLLNNFDTKFTDLVDVYTIGKSVLGRDIKCIRITTEKNKQKKFSCLIDGCIHGSEWEGGEACLYLSEYLLINYGYNETVTNILNTTEVYIVPLLNPDGRQNDDRYNDNGIDLNRNFDIDFGRLRGHSIPLGKIFGRKIPYLSFPRLNLWFTNSGRRPFSEPETRAIRDLMKDISRQDFSFYVTCHTAVHNILSPWGAFKPPFKMTNQEKYIHDYVKEWADENTEYENTPLGYKASGTSTDWCFKEFRIPSFTFEILSKDYEPGGGGGKHDNLVHWMKTTLPFFIYLLVNIANLKNWEIPDIQPPLPDGVPPTPIH